MKKTVAYREARALEAHTRTVAAVLMGTVLDDGVECNAGELEVFKGRLRHATDRKDAFAVARACPVHIDFCTSVDTAHGEGFD